MQRQYRSHAACAEAERIIGKSRCRNRNLYAARRVQQASGHFRRERGHDNTRC
jgi:hypothetical protein